MPIDDRLRVGLPAALDDVRPDVDADLAVVLRKAGRRSRVRRVGSVVGVLAAAAVAAVTLGLAQDDSRRSVKPVGPDPAVQVLDSERGSAALPAPLQEGRYAIPFIGAAEDAPWGEVEVPAGWGQDRLMLATGPDLDPHLRRVELVAVDRVPPDPCGGAMDPVAPSVQAIVSALSDQRTVQPSAVQSTSIGGYSGRLLKFRVPSGLDVEKCWNGAGGLRATGSGGSWTSVFPGWTYRIWVLDVAGDPLVILAAHGPRTTPAERAELTEIVEHIRFVAPR